MDMEFSSVFADELKSKKVKNKKALKII